MISGSCTAFICINFVLGIQASSGIWKAWRASCIIHSSLKILLNQASYFLMERERFRRPLRWFILWVVSKTDLVVTTWILSWLEPHWHPTGFMMSPKFEEYDLPAIRSEQKENWWISQVLPVSLPIHHPGKATFKGLHLLMRNLRRGNAGWFDESEDSLHIRTRLLTNDELGSNYETTGSNF